MTDQATDTKNKILQVARVLFANHGFEGTSVRDIAKAADVNVASVNYHFINKENLFAEILRNGYVTCSQFMRSYYDQNNPSLEDTLVTFFRHLTERHYDLTTIFKMILSEQHSHHAAATGTEDEKIGPPGGKVIMEAIHKEVGREVSEPDFHWALKVLVSHVTHHALLLNCHFKKNNIPYTSAEDIEMSIRRLCRVVVTELKTR